MQTPRSPGPHSVPKGAKCPSTPGLPLVRTGVAIVKGALGSLAPAPRPVSFLHSSQKSHSRGCWKNNCRAAQGSSNASGFARWLAGSCRRLRRVCHVPRKEMGPESSRMTTPWLPCPFFLSLIQPTCLLALQGINLCTLSPAPGGSSALFGSAFPDTPHAGVSS